MKEESFLSSQDEEAGRNSRVIVRVAGYGRLQKKLIPAAPGRRRKRRENDGEVTAGNFGGFEQEQRKIPSFSGNDGMEFIEQKKYLRQGNQPAAVNSTGRFRNQGRSLFCCCPEIHSSER